MPNGEFDTKSMPVSFSVGTSGQFRVRLAPQVQQSEYAGIHQFAPAGGIGDHIDVATKQRCIGFGIALERHVRPFDALRPISVTGRNGKFCARAKLPNSAMTTAILIGVQPMSFHPFRSTRMFLLWS